MKLEILTTAIAEPVIDKPIELLDDHFTLSFAVNGEEYTDFEAIPEGPVTLKIAFKDEADDNIYVDEVAYAEPEAYADEDVEKPEAPSYLYKADDPTAMLKQAVEVPVTITPDMPALSIKLAKYSDTTGIDNIAADTANFVRRGDVLYLTNGNGALYNIAGALVATATANTIDMAGLADGIYILRTGKTAAKIVK